MQFFPFRKLTKKIQLEARVPIVMKILSIHVTNKSFERSLCGLLI